MMNWLLFLIANLHLLHVFDKSRVRPSNASWLLTSLPEVAYQFTGSSVFIDLVYINGISLVR